MPVEQLRKVCALKHWALGVGDDEVVRVCDEALGGDNTAADEALDWYDAWASIHLQVVRRPAPAPASSPEGSEST